MITKNYTDEEKIEASRSTTNGDGASTQRPGESSIRSGICSFFKSIVPFLRRTPLTHEDELDFKPQSPVETPVAHAPPESSLIADLVGQPRPLAKRAIRADSTAQVKMSPPVPHAESLTNAQSFTLSNATDLPDELAAAATVQQHTQAHQVHEHDASTEASSRVYNKVARPPAESNVYATYVTAENQYIKDDIFDSTFVSSRDRHTHRRARTERDQRLNLRSPSKISSTDTLINAQYVADDDNQAPIHSSSQQSCSNQRQQDQHHDRVQRESQQPQTRANQQQQDQHRDRVTSESKEPHEQVSRLRHNQQHPPRAISKHNTRATGRNQNDQRRLIIQRTAFRAVEQGRDTPSRRVRQNEIELEFFLLIVAAQRLLDSNSWYKACSKQLLMPLTPMHNKWRSQFNNLN
mmetsp:Transcript_22434/g.27021  ORF Transcript_22434/g.27021 Transcript_22434/m.27021 type:complete len:407 (-) Transcript_22434:3162-4382(-)